MAYRTNRVDSSNPFREAVEATSCICNGYCTGLRALRGNSRLILPKDTSKLDGSVDIDEQTRGRYPEDSRWDYVVGYAGKAYFLEIHPANTSEVDGVCKKANWLNNWLTNDAPMLKSLMPNKTLYWIASGRCDIRGTAKRKLAEFHISLRGKNLCLPPR